MTGAFVVFVIAGITDGLDGFLAKRFDWSTKLGSWLDPAADKALLVSIYVTLGLYSALPAWLVILVVSRDLLIVGGILLSWLMEQPVAMKTLTIGKLNTAGQILLAALVLADLGLQLGLGNVVNLLILIVAVLTVLSALGYLRSWFKHMVSYQ